jgi:hypothetical protein
MNNVIPVVTLRDLNYSKSNPPVVIPTGTPLDLSFSESNHAKAVFHFNGVRHGLLVSNLHRSVKPVKGAGFRKFPSMAALERMNNDGICTTVTGQRVEPDGVAADGSASWLLVAGVI